MAARTTKAKKPPAVERPPEEPSPNGSGSRDAIERAADALDPILGKERMAEMLANLLWGLANLRFQALGEALGNGLDITSEPYARLTYDGGPPREEYVEDEEGEAETPDGKKCLSIAQRADDLGERIADLQAEVERGKLKAEVERYLEVYRKRAKDEAEKPAENPNE